MTGNANTDEEHPLKHRDVDPSTPPARRASHPLADGEKPDQMAKKTRETGDRQEALVDESVEETFPASDPPTPKRIT